MPGLATPVDNISLTPDISPGPSVTSLYRAAVGPINTDYYLQIFTRFEAAGRAGSSWNWAAGLCTLSWLVFRNLWEAAFIYAATTLTLPLLLLGVGRLLFRWSETVQISVLLTCLALVFVIPGMLGNALFQKRCQHRMNAALSVSATLAEACTRLSRQSSSRKRLIWILVINMALISIIASAGMFVLTRTAPGLAPMKRPAMPVPIAASSPAPEKTSAPVQPPASASATPSVAPLTAPKLIASASIGTGRPLPAVKASTPASAPHVPAGSAHVYVNVGLFATASNAKNAHARVAAAGLPVLSQSIDTSKGPLTRVRAGPFETSSDAKDAIKRIEALGLDAKLVQP